MKPIQGKGDEQFLPEEFDQFDSADSEVIPWLMVGPILVVLLALWAVFG